MKKINGISELEILSYEVRKEIIKMLVSAASGHTAGPLGMAEIFTALYFNLMNHNPKKPWEKNRDRLILSNGHICPLLYTVLAKSNYFPIEELKTFRKINSRLQGHPHMHSAPGVENTGGPLGQGVSFATGIAYAGKMDKKNYKVFLSMSDGELQEGQSWEAIMFAGKNKLDNLIGFVDRNFIQIDGNTEEIMPLEPLAKKFLAFNWDVTEINGNNMKEVLKAFGEAKKQKGKPIVIICNTVPGKGVGFMENKFEWHGKPPTKEEAKIAMGELCREECKLRNFSKEKCEELIKKELEILNEI